MLPADLSAESFQKYPREGRALAAGHVAMLQQLPLCFVPFLLKEMAAYDWKFPAERTEIQQQLSFLEDKSPEERRRQMAVFGGLRLSPQFERFDWVNQPSQFLEQLSAHLWATHQMDAFRAASETYVGQVHAHFPPEQLPAPRLGIAVIGKGVANNEYRLFRKLRREGTYFTNVNPQDGLGSILHALEQRAARYPRPFGHWYIDGAANAPQSCAALTCISYDALGSVRKLLAEKMRAAYEAPDFGPEALRTMMARMEPEDFGFKGESPILDRFQVSLLTEGSGTQIFSTTFVQWAAREVLRRAQPLTLLAHYAPRQHERPMNELLAQLPNTGDDPRGSLVDADMGAYYTWINQQRLSGGEASSFVVWFEDHSEAVAIGPAFPRGRESSKPTTLDTLLASTT